MEKEKPLAGTRQIPDVAKMKGNTMDGETFKRLYAATLDLKIAEAHPPHVATTWAGLVLS